MTNRWVFVATVLCLVGLVVCVGGFFTMPNPIDKQFCAFFTGFFLAKIGHLASDLFN